MANYNDCQLVTDEMGRHCIVAVTNRRPDGQAGSCYTLHAPDGLIVGGGSSQGTSGSGVGSEIAAMRNGRAAAERWLARQPLNAPGTPNHRMRRKSDRGSNAAASSTSGIETLLNAVGANPGRPLARNQDGQNSQGTKGPNAQGPNALSPLARATAGAASLVVHNQIVQIYHALCPGLSKINPVEQWPQARVDLLQNHLNVRPNIAFWKDLFARVQASDFLCGRVPPKATPSDIPTDKQKEKEGPWMANFDWILRPDKMQSILQGKYDNRSSRGNRNNGSSN